jgi:hypothetical protein
MKKTIAILLVLVIGMAGVFAVIPEADASFKVTTTVTPVNRIAVTKATYNGASALTTLAAWEDYVTTNALSTVAAPASEATIGHLNIATNNTSGVAVKVSATPMVSGENDYEIGYYVKVNDSAAIFSGYDNSVETGLDAVSASAATTVVSASETQASEFLSLVTVDILAELDATSFDNAPTATDYEGTVTFEFVS